MAELAPVFFGADYWGYIEKVGRDRESFPVLHCELKNNKLLGTNVGMWPFKNVL